jgi:hypothetical protein
MTEQTTTEDEPILPDGAEEALPSQDKDDAAALAAKEQKESQPQGEEKASLPEQVDDEKLKSFAKGVGIEDISDLSERELKLLKVAKDNQAEYQRNAQKASELEKTLTKSNAQAIADATNNGEVDTAELALARVAALELQTSVNTFFTSNPEARQHEQAMVKLVADRPEVGLLVRQGALSVSDLYSMVRGGDQSLVTEAKTKGAQEALQQLANKQVAKAVPGSATTSAYSASGKKDAFSEGFDSA